MTKDDLHTLYILAGLYLLSKYNALVPDLEQGGVKLYEALHDDAGHKNDLPGKQLTRETVLKLAKATKFANPKLAAAIALAESGGVTNAIARTSREYSVGLWQINTKVHNQYTPADMADPIKNANAAFSISRGGTDWRPWSAYNNGRYRQYLTGVLA